MLQKNIFKFFHPIVISEIVSFSGKNSGKNLLKSANKNFVLENSHKNKQIFAENFYPECLQLKIKNNKIKNNEKLINQWLAAFIINDMQLILFFINNYDDINVNLQNMDGGTALHLASMSGSREVVKMLLRFKNIDINLQNNNGYTALHMAVLYKNKDIVKVLLRNKDIDVNIKNMELHNRNDNLGSNHY